MGQRFSKGPVLQYIHDCDLFPFSGSYHLHIVLKDHLSGKASFFKTSKVNYKHLPKQCPYDYVLCIFLAIRCGFFFSNLKEKLLWNHFFVGINVRKVAKMFLFHGGVISLVASSGQF